METVTIVAKLPPKLLDELQKVIQEGWYTDESDAIRDAVRKLLKERTFTKEELNILKDVAWGLHG
jgi:Arc/MetJ-type ribon-helix-helix transcriptional regulator